MIIKLQAPNKQSLFVLRNMSIFPNDWFADKKYLFPQSWPAASTELVKIANFTLIFREYENNTSRIEF